MQVRFATGLTSEQYVIGQAWRHASLPRCPAHPQGGCRFHRHGTYARKTPSGTLIARWYCRDAHQTFSLLPDCLAARFPGALDDLEAVVAVAEQAPSRVAAANRLRTDNIVLPSAVRWVHRRVRAVHRNLVVLIGLLPAVFAGTEANVCAMRVRLGLADSLLLECRRLATPHLHALRAPVGLKPYPRPPRHPIDAFQQQMGTAPPSAAP